MVPVDREHLVRLLADLVRLNSINPALDPAGPGEGAIARYVAQELGAAGLEVATHEPAPGRVSVVGRLAGRSPGRRLMLNAHLDTVGVAGMTEPFAGTVRHGRLYGRGAYDMKGGLAACLAAARALAAAGAPFAGSLLVWAVADEEHASLGTADLIGRYPVDAAIVTEPTGLEICLAHKGFAWIEIVTRGRSAHGSRPDLGKDANLAMGRILARLDELARELDCRPPHPLVGRPSLHVGLLAGGTAPSVYAAHCRAVVERRTVPGETDQQALAEIAALVRRLAEEDRAFEADCRVLLARAPFEVPRETEIVQVVARALEGELGTAPRYGGQTPWMDSALLAAAGVPTVVIGPDGAGAHADQEWVDLESVYRLSRILVRATLEYCRT